MVFLSNNMPPPLSHELDGYGGTLDGVSGPCREFVRGPIPVWWLARAAALPGKALAVGLAVWFRRGLCKKRTFRLFPSAPTRFGVNRFALYRALKALEGAGLVTVQRVPGGSPVITLITNPTRTSRPRVAARSARRFSRPMEKR
jgi:hypothetical protein